jgi:peptide/nickel transport system substrate-binding protein
MINQRVYKDKRLRQAIDKAIDREGIAKMLQHAEPIETPIRKDTKFFDSSVTYTYNPEQAKAILQAAAADGAIDLSQPFVICTPPGIREKVANIIQQNLKAVGMDTKIQVMEAATMFAGFYKGTTGIGLVNRSALADPMYMKVMLSNNPQYFSGIADDTWDQYYNQYLAASTEQDKINVVKSYQEKWLDEVPIVFYAATYKDYGYNSRLGDDIGVEDMDMGNLPVWQWKVK